MMPELQLACFATIAPHQASGHHLPHQEHHVPAYEAEEHAQRMPGLHLACPVEIAPLQASEHYLPHQKQSVPVYEAE